MSAAEELTVTAAKDTAYAIAEGPQQCADNADADLDAGGDARNAAPAAPATGPPAPTAAPSGGVAGVDKQCVGGAPESASSAPAFPPPGNTDKPDNGSRYNSSSRGYSGTRVIYVRVPADRYPPTEYYRDTTPYRSGGGGGWDGGGGGWGGGGGGRGSRTDWLGLPDGGDWEGADAFSHQMVRRAFIRKVYATLSLQLAITLAIIAVFVFEPSVQKFVFVHVWPWILALVGYFVSFFALVCSGELRRRSPCNIILLFIYTLSFSFLLGVISARYQTYIVFMAIAMTTVIVLLVTMVATFSKVDLTGCASVLCMLTAGFMLFFVVLVVVALTWGVSKMLWAVWAGIGAILFSMYLMYDTQLIMGGRNIELSPDEYIFATLMLYSDIVNILYMLLLMLGCCLSE